VSGSKSKQVQLPDTLCPAGICRPEGLPGTRAPALATVVRLKNAGAQPWCQRHKQTGAIP